VRRRFPDRAGDRMEAGARAEDHVNEIVFGGDDPAMVGEVVEVWPSREVFDAAADSGAWGDVWAVWGTADEVDAELQHLGPYRDSKGRVERPASILWADGGADDGSGDPPIPEPLRGSWGPAT
jgi:hypothetical protein